MLGIYIHIPFCRQKCKYCDFNSYSGLENMSSSYTEMLIREIQNSSQAGKTADTIYIGGGTPTYINAEYINSILAALKDCFIITDDAEITIECNPGTADYEKLSLLRQAGINRLSIGLQSDNDKILRTLGRIHTYEEFESCLSDALKAEFENVSADLMFGLPGQTHEIWKSTLKNISQLPLSHISAYSLKIEPGTPFYDMFNCGELNIPDDDINRDMYDDCVYLLSQNGFERYEISNFARGGKLSKHNLKYWTGGDYIGFGAGASSRIGNIRSSNLRGIKEYTAAVSETGSAEDGNKTISNTDREAMSEYIILSLRLAAGVSESEFRDKFGRDIFEVFPEVLKRHLNITHTLLRSGGRIRIKPEYFYVSNAVLVDFL